MVLNGVSRESEEYLSRANPKARWISSIWETPALSDTIRCQCLPPDHLRNLVPSTSKLPSTRGRSRVLRKEKSLATKSVCVTRVATVQVGAKSPNIH